MRSQDVLGKRRLKLAAPCIVLMFLGILGRVVYLTTFAAPEFRRRAALERRPVRKLPAERGRILDRNGRVLAFNLEEFQVVFHPRIVGDKSLCARLVASVTGAQEARLRALLSIRKNYVPTGIIIPAEMVARLRKELRGADPAAKLNGVEFERRSRRVYPLGTVAASVIGALNQEGKGFSGVEGCANSLLEGEEGLIEADFDRQDKPIPTRMRRSKEPVPGRDIVLTLDSRIQYAAEQSLGRQMRTYRAASGSCVVLDPDTGEILAIAEYPTFNPAKWTMKDVPRMRSGAANNLYEPGSTMKVITAEAALRNRLGSVTSVCTGRIGVGNRSVNCPCSVRRREPGQPVTLARMMKYSCNTEAITLARRMGSRKLYQEFQRFGLLEPYRVPGMGVTGGGQVPNPNKYRWADIRLANVSFGQGVATTRLNLASAYAAVANGGVLMHPQLIREIRTADGTVTKPFAVRPLRRVASIESCARLREFLLDTVERGTGKNARIEGYQIGGKTGTAQFAAGGRKGFISGAYISSFCGIAPLDDPKVTILVTVERPRGSSHGATVAAPVFKDVAQKALWYAAEVAPAGVRSAGQSPHRTAPKAPRVGASTRTTGKVFGGSGTGREG